MAWTERYCSPTGAGAHDGTTAGDAWDLGEAITNANAGHRINLIAGTYANTTTSRTFATGAGAATTTAPKWWRGYTSTIGDLDSHPSSTRTAGTDFPLLTFTTGSVSISGVHQIFSNIEFRMTGAGATRLVSVTGSKCKFIRCRFDNQDANSASYAVRASADGGYFNNCWFKATSTATHVVVSEERILFDGCVVRGGGNGFFLTGAFSQEVLDCICDDNGDDGIELQGSASVPQVIDGCTVYSPGGHGINNTSAVPCNLLVRGCLFHTITTAGKYAINMFGGTSVPHITGNAYYNVTTRFNNVTESLEFFAISEGSDPCTNAASHDFSLVSGASSKGAALPQLFENESYKGWRDAGAVQREEPASSSGLVIATRRGGTLMKM